MLFCNPRHAQQKHPNKSRQTDCILLPQTLRISGCSAINRDAVKRINAGQSTEKSLKITDFMCTELTVSFAFCSL